MKAKLALLAALLTALISSSAQTARVTLFCNSLQFELAAAGAGEGSTLRLTSDASFADLNGEVAPLFQANLPTHGTYFLLDDLTFPDRLAGQIAFDQPEHVDANQNGFDDFFEVSEAVPATTTQGLFVSQIDRGSVKAQWSRAAGSTTGTCRLTLIGETFGELPAFVHTFHLLQYTGTLAYQSRTNGITAVLTLAQSTNETNRLDGMMSFQRALTNRFDRLILQVGALTNASGLTMEFESSEITRDTNLNTNYFGFLDFEDGDPATSANDYRDWVLSIDDPNDADGDSIPDFSDDAGTLVEVPPTLSLARAGNELVFTISGRDGSSYDLEAKDALGLNNWQTVVSISLTNSPQPLILVVPDTPSRFWRARGR